MALGEREGFHHAIELWREALAHWGMDEYERWDRLDDLASHPIDKEDLRQAWRVGWSSFWEADIRPEADFPTPIPPTTLRPHRWSAPHQVSTAALTTSALRELRHHLGVAEAHGFENAAEFWRVALAGWKMSEFDGWRKVDVQCAHPRDKAELAQMWRRGESGYWELYVRPWEDYVA